MADFNALLGNGNGVVCVFGDFQTGGELYTSFYKEQLSAVAEAPLAGQKVEVAKNQGIFENTDKNRKRIELLIKQLVTKIEGVYTFGKAFYFNQTLSATQVLDMVIAGNMTEFLFHEDTVQMTNANDEKKLIDSLIPGTEAP